MIEFMMAILIFETLNEGTKIGLISILMQPIAIFIQENFDCLFKRQVHAICCCTKFQKIILKQS
jgi:hypothetical protein